MNLHSKRLGAFDSHWLHHFEQCPANPVGQVLLRNLERMDSNPRMLSSR